MSKIPRDIPSPQPSGKGGAASNAAAESNAPAEGNGWRFPKAPPRNGAGPRILMVAGENSGDNFGAELARELLRRQPDATIYGLGGDWMAQAGASPVLNIAQNLAIVGFTGVLAHYGTLRGLLNGAYEALERDRPDIVALVDYPGYNQRVAERASELGIPVVWYVCPQFWAWNERRKWKLARVVDAMMVFFPFEKTLCEEAGIKAFHVGHPTLDTLRVAKGREQTLADLGLDPAKPVVGILPGSRNSEVERLLDPMLDAAEIVAKELPAAQFVLIQATTISDERIAAHLKGRKLKVAIANKGRNNARAACDFAFVASGTATLETAILGVPHAVVYKTNPATWAIGKRLAKVKWVGLSNLVAQRTVAPELLQDEATGAKIAAAALDCLKNPEKTRAAKRDMDEVRRLMGGQGASARAADVVERVLEKRRQRPFIQPIAPQPPPNPKGGPRLLMIAGENSGDNFAAELARALLKRIPTAQIYGLGGERMARAGVAPLENIAQNLAVIGFLAVARHWGVFQTLKKSVFDSLERDRPDALLTIDYPGFNSVVAERAHDLGIPTIHYVCPQFWAWKARRKWKLARVIDLMMVLFRFEEPLCRTAGINARYVGHPLLDTLRVTKGREQVCRENGLDPDRPIIGLLPGSRKREVSRLLPVMLDGAEMFLESEPEAQFVLVQANTIRDELVAKRLRGRRLPLAIVGRDRMNMRAVMDFAWVASGTATLETAVLGVPHLIVYSTDFLTWVIGQRLVQTPYIGLVNIVAEDRVVPELLQDEATGQNICDATLGFLRDPEKMAELRRGLEAVRRVIGGSGAAERAADLVASFLEELKNKPKEQVKGEMLRAASLLPPPLPA